ncbi:unnamed protein product [Linum trigynum]|uniref:Uncharacterized protein n=1 Tax=Linum trigynum TaxID=586398 RepID=A0AAV2DBM4_9ROSI
MVSTKSMTAAEKAANAAYEQGVTAATTVLPSSGDGIHGVPSPRDGELVDETIGEELRTDLDKMEDAVEHEHRSRQADSQKLWLAIGELKVMLTEALGRVGGGGGGTGGQDSTAEAAASGGCLAHGADPAVEAPAAAKAMAPSARGRRWRRPPSLGRVRAGPEQVQGQCRKGWVRARVSCLCLRPRRLRPARKRPRCQVMTRIGLQLRFGQRWWATIRKAPMG